MFGMSQRVSDAIGHIKAAVKSVEELDFDSYQLNLTTAEALIEEAQIRDEVRPKDTITYAEEVKILVQAVKDNMPLDKKAITPLAEYSNSLDAVTA
jgi:hypothetical protein